MNKARAYDEAGKTAVLQNIHGTVQFLQRFPPFNQMEDAHLGFLVEHCRLRFFAAGESIIKPDDGPVADFHIVKQGRVVGERQDVGKSASETTFEITTGECFPLAALLGERATRTEHLAGEDTFCFLLGKETFARLFSLSAPFRDFALRGVSSLLDQVNQQVQQRAAQTLGAEYSLDTRLGDLALRQPVTCLSDTPLREAVRQMHEQQVGSIVIVDAQQAPLGIFTLRDLRQVVADNSADLSEPIARLMTQTPFHLSPDASAFDAALAMTERHIAHVCVVRDQRLCGVVSERDLFSLQRIDLVHLARTIRNAPRIDSLALMQADVRQLVERMLAHGASSTQLTQIITLLNDHVVSRVIELNLMQWRAEHDDFNLTFTWLCFGSEGRCEQTLHTDQDNGLLFEARDAEDAARIRSRLLPLAGRINQDLATCGFSLCHGNIMAGNPELCLSRDEWTQRFATWVRDASPENLLRSSIFFDLRAVWSNVAGGGEQACTQLRRGILERVADNPLFQRMLADNALRQRPPVGRFRDFVVARKGVEKDTLDLKSQGLMPFVDGARLLALANGIEATNTLQRLRQLVAAELIDAQDGAAYEEAYHFIQQTRMQQHQLQARQQQPYSNRLDPDSLNHLDRRILREAFRQAQRLQASLTLRYQL